MRRGFSYNDAETLQGLFLNLLKCATPFQRRNLQLRLQTKTNRDSAAGEEKESARQALSVAVGLIEPQ